MGRRERRERRENEGRRGEGSARRRGGAEKGQRGEGAARRRGGKMRGGLTGNMGRVERVYIRLYKRYAREEDALKCREG